MLFFAENALKDFSTSLPDGQTYNYWGDFVNMLITLVFIIGLIFVSIWFLKKIMRSRVYHLNRSTGIKILERRALNAKASLYLIKALDKGILISDSPSGIQVLTEFPPETNMEQLLEEMQMEPRPIKESFAQKIKKLASKNA